MTDVSPLDAPEGALRQADEVSFYRPGIVTPRPGFGDTTGVGSRSTTYRPIELWPFDGDVIVQSESEGSYRIELLSADTQIDTANVDPPDTALRGRSAAMESRGSLYITGDAGVRKLAASSDTSTSPAGLRTNYHPPATTTHTTTGLDFFAIAADNAVAYRYCYMSEDANGYVRRSAPSSRWEVASSADCLVQFDRIYLPAGVVAGDFLEMYRTQGSGAAATTPSGDYYLATRHQITAAEVTAGFVESKVITDTTRDGLLGPALYTSNSQGGPLAAKNPPPLCNSLAEWQGCGWYGNTRERNVFPLSIVSVYDSGNSGNDITGLHHSVRTGTVAGGTAMTAVSGVDGLRVDMYVSDSGDPTAAGTYIGIANTVSKIYAKITLDHASITSGGSSVTIFGQQFTFENSPSASSDVQLGINSTEDATNLAAVLDGWDFYPTAGFNITGTATSSTDTVTFEDDQGNGPEVTVGGAGITVAYEITLKNASTGSGTASFEFHDALTIESVEFYAVANGVGADLTSALVGNDRLFGVRNSTPGSETTYDSAVDTAQQLAAAINAYGIVTDPSWGVRAIWDGDGAEVLLIRTEPSGATISVSATPRGESYSPDLGKATTNEGEDSRKRGRLWWSLPQEPEAVPPLNFTDIGNTSADILELVPLDAALLVFKTDGVWRVSGSPPSSWIVDELRAGSTPVRLLAAGCTCVLDGVCYAWTDRGVVAVTEGGVDPIPVSSPIATELRAFQALLPLGQSDEKRGFYMQAHPRRGEVALAVAATATDDYSGAWYVWSRATGAWAKWLRSDRCAAYDSGEDRMLVSPSWASWSVLYERSDEDAAASYYDETAGLGAEHHKNGVVTVAKSLIPWTPTTCDVMQVTAAVDGESYLAVTAVASNGTDWDLTISSTNTNDINVSIGTATLYQGIGAVLMYQPQQAMGLGHRWAELHAHFAACTSAFGLSIPVLLGGAAHRDSAVSTVTASVTPPVTLSEPVRGGLPRACVRTPHFYPYVKVCTAGAAWELSHIYAHGYPTSRRVAR